MLDTLEAPYSTTAKILGDVRVVYCTEAKEARRLLKEMLAGADWVAIDIETAPFTPVAKQIANLMHARAELTGTLKALKKVRAPAQAIEMLTIESERIDKELKHAGKAGLDPRRARIRLLQVYDGGDECLVIDLDRTHRGLLSLLDGANIIAHNAAFELSFLEEAAVSVGSIICTLQAARLEFGGWSAGLDTAAEAFLDLRINKTLQTSEWGALQLSKEQIDYAAIDAVAAWRLALKLLPLLDRQKSAYDIQMKATPAAVRMEARGFKINVEAHAKLIAQLKQDHAEATQAYREACLGSGHPGLADEPAPSSPKEKEALLVALLSSDELARWKRTARSGALSTARAELTRASRYPPILALVKLNRINKLVSAFGDNLTTLVSPVTGRIHAHYKVAATAAGRASCSGPNVQQIPNDERFRSLFIPEPGNVLVVADYNSMELRAAAYVSGDAEMTKAFEQGLDLHRITAARMLNKDPSEVTPEERKAAKSVNFGAIYGQGSAGLVGSAWANFDTVLEPIEAQAWLQAFADAYHGFAQWRRDHHQRCEDRGFIAIGKDAEKLGIGRIFPKSRMKEGASFYTRCCNLPIQGSCSDAAMLALAYVDDRLFDMKIDGGPVAWLHDEIVMEVPVEHAERAAAILKQAMIDGFAETFPGAPLDGLVEPKIGDNWAMAKTGAIRTASDVAPERVKLRDVAEDAFQAEATADLGRGPPAGFPEASGAMSFYEFFCGGGMARAGLGAEWKCLLANDIDRAKAAAYADNFGREGLVVRDVAQLKLSDLPGAATLAWSSFPCQDLSLAGDRAGLGAARSGTFWAFWRLMQGLRAEGRAPQLIVIENVPGLITSHSGRDFDAICDALADAGYRYGALMIDAVHFVPQSRERVFIIAVDKSIPVPAALIDSEPSLPFHSRDLVAACRRQRDPLWWRLSIPPIRNTVFADLIEDRPTGVIWHTQAETGRLIAMMAPVHAVKLEAAKRSGKRMVGWLYRRMRDEPGGRVQRAEVRFDDVAGCLRMPTGGSSRQTIMVVEGPSVRSRLLSAREAARLMGLLDTYVLPSSYNDGYGLMGDGVVAPVVRFLAEHILEPILEAWRPRRNLPEPEVELSGEELLRSVGL
jgi:DNA (cytosine-5)-methyltransferase 1